MCLHGTPSKVHTCGEAHCTQNGQKLRAALSQFLFNFSPEHSKQNWGGGMEMEKIEINGKQQLMVCIADAKRANTTNKTNYYEGWPRN